MLNLLGRCDRPVLGSAGVIPQEVILSPGGVLVMPEWETSIWMLLSSTKLASEGWVQYSSLVSELPQWAI